MPHGAPRAALRALAGPAGESPGAFGAFTGDSVRFADRPWPGALRARSPAKGFRPCAYGAHRAEKHAARRAASWVTPQKHYAKGASVNPVCCAQCGGLTAYCIRPDGLFECPECGNTIDRRDIDLDGTEVWAVNSDGRLCTVIDPAASLSSLMEAVEENLAAEQLPNAQYARLASMESATAALALYIDARRAGIKRPSFGYTEAQVLHAVNEGADMVLGELSLGESGEDAINLVVNGAMKCLEKPGSSFSEMVADHYDETVEEIHSWWGWNK
ncbi:hypothetical protein [Streptomyces antimycoticus]|uniref:hypothetical protein n=1 Tax=Streptomyces antimycoticus TaxID=68175 RepID=UPI0036E6644B